jgi:CRP/FNR family transcriptional regulator
VIIENYLTQNDIAQIICTSRQTTTQLLNEMEAKGRCSTIEKKLL